MNSDGSKRKPKKRKYTSSPPNAVRQKCKAGKHYRSQRAKFTRPQRKV